MNQIITIAIFIIIFIVGIYFLTGSNVENISVDQLRLRLNSDKKIAVIDVRTPSEYNGKIGHIENSILMPLSELEQSLNKVNWKEYDEIYTICLAGGRSARAVSILQKNDIQAINVRGGMTAWNLLK
ncbi:MAG: sulfurtransferase [Candidatus Marinimicrobia bacterium]|nr:sulfurtransferase [Candidatus Neomarinimicrobiota bacterium]|tara:strand:- start:543 stop:923 length:381 start_codon:yes stop_codon:yes gene_type:complete